MDQLNFPIKTEIVDDEDITMHLSHRKVIIRRMNENQNEVGLKDDIDIKEYVVNAINTNPITTTPQLLSSAEQNKELLINKLKQRIEQLEKQNSELQLQNEMLKEESFQQRVTIYKYRQKEAEKKEEIKTNETLSYNDTKEGDRVYTNYNIKLSQAQQAELAVIPIKNKSDSKYVFKLLDFVFSKFELSNASLTGNASKNPNYETKASVRLDEIRLKFVLEMFKARVYAPDPTEELSATQRLKKFNHFINIKIQNTRASQKPRRKRSAKPASDSMISLEFQNHFENQS